jgi:flagellar protein FlaD
LLLRLLFSGLVAKNVEKEKDREVIDIGDVDEDEIELLEEAREVEVPPVETTEVVEEAPVFEAGELPGFDEAVGSKELEEAMQKVTELENTVERVDSTLAVIKRTNEETVEKVNAMEGTLSKLNEIYDRVTKEMGAFESGEVEVREEVIVEEEPEEGPSIAGEPQKPDVGGETETEPQKPVLEQRIPPETPETLRAPSAKPVPKPRAEEITLTDIDNTPASIVIMLRWLDFLLKKAGHDGLMDVLMYYEDIGWITGNVRNRMVKYSRGVAREELLEQPDGEMEVEDHIISLFFVSKLKGIEISPGLYSSVIGKLEELGLLE